MEWITDVLFNRFLDPLLDTVVPWLVAFIIGWVAVLYTRITGKDLEARHREALQSALSNGIRSAIQALLNGVVPERMDPETQTLVLAKATEYVRDSVPDAVKHFNLDDWGIGKLLLPKMPLTIEGKSALVNTTATSTSTAT